MKIAQWASVKRIRRPFKKAAAVLNIRIGGSGYAAPFHISLERSYSHPVLLASVLAIVDRITAATMLMLIQLLVKMMAMMTSVYILGEV